MVNLGYDIDERRNKWADYSSENGKKRPLILPSTPRAGPWLSSADEKSNLGLSSTLPRCRGSSVESFALGG